MPKSGDMRNPKVTTDGTVDTSSLDSIVADVLQPRMTDEQKVLALWHFWKRTIYHYGWPYVRPEKEENWQDPIKCINVHGYALCGGQARVFGRLLGRVFGEENTRLIGLTEIAPGAWELDKEAGAFVDTTLLRDYDPSKPMGHTALEVRYGGRWRLIDPHVHFYAYLRGRGGIAGAEDLIADPSLVTNPARRITGLMPCGDLSRVFYASKFTDWGTLSREAAPDNHTMDIVLRRGETYTRYWDRKGPFYWFAEMDRRWDPGYVGPGPRHICEAEAGWRHYGNGELVYCPRFADGSYRDGVVEEQGLGVPSAVGLMPSRARQTGRVLFAVRVPYLVVDSRLKLTATRATGSDRLRVWVRLPQSGWRLVWQEPRGGRVQRELDLSPWVGGRYGYEVRFELAAARRPEHVTLHSFILYTTFVLNYLALPRLLPGRNSVRVTVADPATLPEQRLEVTYAWRDRDGEHEDSRVVTSSPYTYETTVAPVTTTPPENPKYMRFLRMKLM